MIFRARSHTSFVTRAISVRNISVYSTHEDWVERIWLISVAVGSPVQVFDLVTGTLLVLACF